jgi:regulator of sirC expression with transglutaminase-like and TPR domain
MSVRTFILWILAMCMVGWWAESKSDEVTVKMLTELAALHVQAGRFDEAYQVAGKVLQMAPGHPVAQEIRGDVFVSSALKSYRAAAAAGENGRVAAKIAQAERILGRSESSD